MKKSVLAGLSATVCWGFSNVLSKYLLAHFAPLSLLAIQLIASNICLWAFLAFQKKPNCLKKSFKYSLPGILQPGLAFTFSVFGLNLTTANSEALIWAVETIVIIFLAAFLLHERISLYTLLLAICGTFGTIMATTPNVDTHFDILILLGNILILLGVICAAFYSICSQNQLNDIDPLLLTALHQLSGLILVMCIWLAQFLIFGSFPQVNSSEFLLALVSGLTAYALPFFFYLVAIKDIGVSKTSIFLVLPPIFTICGSFFVFGDKLNYIQWIGVVLALLAVSGICLSKDPAPKVIVEPGV
jgi:drug/metabolite transporter (DMT)-like permease